MKEERYIAHLNWMRKITRHLSTSVPLPTLKRRVVDVDSRAFPSRSVLNVWVHCVDVQFPSTSTGSLSKNFSLCLPLDLRLSFLADRIRFSLFWGAWEIAYATYAVFVFLVWCDTWCTKLILEKSKEKPFIFNMKTELRGKRFRNTILISIFKKCPRQ